MKKLLLSAIALIAFGQTSINAQNASPSFGYSVVYDYFANPDISKIEIQAYSGTSYIKAFELNYVKDANNHITSGTASSPFTPEVSKTSVTVNGLVRVYVTESAPSSGGTYQPIRRETYYNDGTNDTVIVMENYEVSSDTFELSNKVTFEWHAPYLYSKITNYYWSTSSNSWVYLGHGARTFNGNNEILTDSSYVDDAGNVRINDYKEYTYTGGKIVEYLEYQYDFGTSNVELDKKVVITVDANGYTTAAEEMEWDASANVFENDVKFVFGYSDPVGLAAQKITDKPLVAFPNPAVNHVTIQINTPSNASTIELYNIAGKLIYQEQNISSADLLNKSINLSNLSEGIYVLKAITNQAVYTSKIQKL